MFWRSLESSHPAQFVTRSKSSAWSHWAVYLTNHRLLKKLTSGDVCDIVQTTSKGVLCVPFIIRFQGTHVIAISFVPSIRYNVPWADFSQNTKSLNKQLWPSPMRFFKNRMKSLQNMGEISAFPFEKRSVLHWFHEIHNCTTTPHGEFLHQIWRSLAPNLEISRTKFGYLLHQIRDLLHQI